jgi:hypothetical protein
MNPVQDSTYREILAAKMVLAGKMKKKGGQ